MSNAYVLRYDEIYQSHEKSTKWLETSPSGYGVSSELYMLQSCYLRFINETIQLEGNTGDRLRSYFAEGPLTAFVARHGADSAV
jgi:hypothetical protein